MNEIWKTIEDYPNYQVSNLGRIKSKKRLKENHNGLQIVPEKIIKQCIRNGYKCVTLWKNGIGKTLNTHKIIAIAFIPNTENKPCIDHINTNKTDNRVENLRWVTYKENMNNPKTIENCKNNSGKSMLGKFGKQHPKSKIILQFDKNGNFIKKWDSISDIKRELNFNQGHISSCCNGKRKSVNGFIWKYNEDNEYKLFANESIDKYNET